MPTSVIIGSGVPPRWGGGAGATAPRPPGLQGGIFVQLVFLGPVEGHINSITFSTDPPVENRNPLRTGGGGFLYHSQVQSSNRHIVRHRIIVRCLIFTYKLYYKMTEGQSI